MNLFSVTDFRRDFSFKTNGILRHIRLISPRLHSLKSFPRSRRPTHAWNREKECVLSSGAKIIRFIRLATCLDVAGQFWSIDSISFLSSRYAMADSRPDTCPRIEFMVVKWKETQTRNTLLTLSFFSPLRSRRRRLWSESGSMPESSYALIMRAKDDYGVVLWFPLFLDHSMNIFSILSCWQTVCLATGQRILLRFQSAVELLWLASHVFKYREHLVILLCAAVSMAFAVHSLSPSHLCPFIGKRSDVERKREKRKEKKALISRQLLALSTRTESPCRHKMCSQTVAKPMNAVGVEPTACKAMWCRWRTSCDHKEGEKREHDEEKANACLLFSSVPVLGFEPMIFPIGWLGHQLTTDPNVRAKLRWMARENEREQLFLHSSRMLCRAADSPLMKNKTPCVFFSRFALFVFFSCSSSTASFVRISLSLSLSFSPILSRALSFACFYYYPTRTHTHTLSSTSSGLFASSSSVVYVFFTTIITSED